MVTAVEPARTLKIGVELVPGSEPVTGTLSAGAEGKTTPFTGWIELVASLQEAIAREQAQGGAHN